MFPTDKEVAYYATYITGHPEAEPDAQHLAATRAVLGGLAKDDRIIFPTIRVIELGDHDDQMLLRIIGPYQTEADRDAALERLSALPFVKMLRLLPSTIPASVADQAVAAQVAAEAKDGSELLEEFWN